VLRTHTARYGVQVAIAGKLETVCSGVVGSLEALPKTRVILAVALTAASYLLLTGYDFLALSYADHKLRSRETLFASFIFLHRFFVCGVPVPRLNTDRR
jgi:hypothetical protein